MTVHESANIFIRTYDVDLLRFIYPEWDTLDKQNKLQLIQTTGVEAMKRVAVHNVSCVRLHEFLAKVINPEYSVGQTGSVIAFGNDNSSFSASDTTLNNEVGRVDVTDVSTNISTAETTFTSFVDSTEMNGYTLSELGLYSSADELFNHAGISPTINKTNTETVVADVVLGFSN